MMVDSKMKWGDLYYKNRPLINSIFTGTFYFLLGWSIDMGDATKELFMALMLFLPGVTFPLATCYFKTKSATYSDWVRIIHLVLSVGIYHASVWLFSAEGRIEGITIVAGLSGSLLFLLVTRYLLKLQITWWQIALTSVLSGIAFLPYELSGRSGVLMGLAVFLWTIVNGATLNHVYRKVLV